MFHQRIRDFSDRDRHAVLLAVVIVALTGILWPEPAATHAATRITPAELCRRSLHHGTELIVPFDVLRPTNDPCVWEYTSGHPAQFYPVDIRVVFSKPVEVRSRPVVSGIVDRMIPDSLPRASRALGILVITSAQLESGAQP